MVHTGADLQHVLHFVENGQQALEVMFGLVGMDVGYTGKLSDDFVDPRVVLHGARAQRVEPRVDTKISL